MSTINSYISAVRARQEEVEAQGGISNAVLPALWTVQREGHNLVAAEERSTAAFSLRNWVQHGTFITMRSGRHCFMPASSFMSHRPALLVDATARSLTATVLRVHPIFKSFVINATAADLKEWVMRRAAVGARSARRAQAFARWPQPRLPAAGVSQR